MKFKEYQNPVEFYYFNLIFIIISFLTWQLLCLFTSSSKELLLRIFYLSGCTLGAVRCETRINLAQSEIDYSRTTWNYFSTIIDERMA